MGFEMISALVGVVIGGLITFFIEKALQDREFKKAEKDRIVILKSLLQTLAQEIEDVFKRIKGLRNSIHGSYPREFFDVDVNKSVVAELIKTELFPNNKDIFDRVIRMISRLSLLNKQVEVMQDVISGKDSRVMNQNSKLRMEADYAISIIDDLINADIRETNNRPELSIKIESIAQNL